jgi:hypothetical protein
VDDSTVRLVLRDTLFLRMLFSTRPKEASYSISTPSQRRGSNRLLGPKIVTIPIVYRP